MRWDDTLWRRVIEGPARDLAESLRDVGTNDSVAQQVLEAYLRLAAEAVGLGYVSPPEIGRGFLNEAFFRLLPRDLPALPAERRARVLAECWNLGENLEHSAPWWRRLFLRLLDGEASLANLRALVDRAARDAFGEPEVRLGGKVAHHFVDLGSEDRRFLPGALHFVAPTVVCVHDRLPQEGGPARTLGVWLVDAPVSLGPMGCTEDVGESSDRLDLVEDLAGREPRAADVLNSAANDWRAGLTLETSQFLVGISPA